MLFNPAPGNGSRGFSFSGSINRSPLNNVIGVVPDGAFALRVNAKQDLVRGAGEFRDSVGMQIFDRLSREAPANHAFFRTLVLLRVRCT
ncbi:hypothetical protein SBC1_31960 [Caballeronia sp. SBC1]|nr:hypothetical protein SBC2_31830 [Caballeronia sp. SBC2]QIN63167.1 hypothetical protein SBC1_31960 [Caballeronia sp. SBC1]